jgi:hypothetical protein
LFSVVGCHTPHAAAAVAIGQLRIADVGKTPPGIVFKDIDAVFVVVWIQVNVVTWRADVYPAVGNCNLRALLLIG